MLCCYTPSSWLLAYHNSLKISADFMFSNRSTVCQVVGALNQPLAHEWRHQPNDDGVAEALFRFIFHDRAMIVAGTWDGERDRYVEHGADFTVVLKRSRLYRSFKQTPVHLSGVKDKQANAHQLIDDASRRGKKVRIEDMLAVAIFTASLGNLVTVTALLRWRPR